MRPWEELPARIRVSEVRPYYESLCKKSSSLKVKFLLDKLLALFLLVLVSPVLLIIAVFIKAEDGGSVLFRQERVTTYGRHFRICKFRTMVMDAERKGSLVTGAADSRITRTGHLLRKCRLDELPQLLNVLAGDMSFVGTRPEVPRYVEQYTGAMMATLLLPAGITSPTSIVFKDEDALMEKWIQKGYTADQAYVEKVLPKKMQYNLKYTEQLSVPRDVAIMIRTVVAVLK